MKAPWETAWAGRIDRLLVHGAALEGNPLGDPVERPLWVYVPPGYDDEPDTRYPSIYVIQGYTGSVTMWSNRAPTVSRFPEAADRIFASGEAPPCIVVYVDAWTPTAAPSSSTPRGPAGTTPTCAKTWCRLSTLATGPWQTAAIGASRASQAAASGP